MRTLVVYYSLTGMTRTVAGVIATSLSADLEEIACDAYKPGFLGYLMAAFDVWRGHRPAIAPQRHAPENYDLVIVGGPMWAGHIATPVAAYLAAQSGRLRNVAFFLTHGGATPEKVFLEMKSLSGALPRAVVSLREAEVRKGAHAMRASLFVDALLADQPV